MPTYSYSCTKCNTNFELFFYIKDYIEKPKCSRCNCQNTFRRYADDVLTQSATIKKSDTELKTIGDLAKRNSDKLSDDEKIHLHNKHNSYKYDGEISNLPSGMSRVKKPPKPAKWTNSIKQKRKMKNG